MFVFLSFAINAVFLSQTSPSNGQLCILANNLCRDGNEVSVTGKIEKFENIDPFGVKKKGIQVYLFNEKQKNIKVYFGTTVTPDYLNSLKSSNQTITAVGFQIDFKKDPLIIVKEVFAAKNKTKTLDWTKYYRWLPQDKNSQTER